MMDMLIQLPGPIFLVYFTLLATFSIIIGWLWVKTDGSIHHPLPDMTRLDPFEIAALRDGCRGVIQIALFNLWNNNLITLTGKGNASQIRRVNSSSHQPENEIEEVLYQFASIKRRPADFFLDPSVLYRIDKQIKNINFTLEKLHLKRTYSQLTRSWLALWITLVIILCLGGIKLYFEIISGDSVEFLMITIALLVIIILNVLTPSQQSQLGQLYLKKLAHHFSWLKAENNNDVNSSLRVAIFGIQALASSPLFASFEQTFGKGAIKIGNYGSNPSSGGCGGG
jgi:uncharacterized protein (TIGR04222 family)